jgi:putative glutamine amidotransferase
VARKIGIVGYQRNDMFGVHPDYLNFVEQFGTPVIIPKVTRKDFFRNFKLEGLVLPGGADVDPKRYATNKIACWLLSNWYCYPSDPYLEHFDTEILPGLAHMGFPIFGICRGLQTLNVHFGGTLRNVYKHPTNQKKEELVHTVYPTKGNAFVNKTNSFHHQAIGRLADVLLNMGETSDKVIERIVHQTLPIAAVQYHPERMADEWSNATCRDLFA